MDINDMNLGQNDISMIMHEQSDAQDGDPNEETGLLTKELVFAKQNAKKLNLNQVLNNELPSESEYSESVQSSAVK